MRGMLVPWVVVLLASRVVHADFHFLNCVSTGPSGNPIPTNPTIVVPASDMGSCTGILGERMVVLENLTQPISIALTSFGFNNLCDAGELNVYIRSSDLLAIYYAIGYGALEGQCSPSPAYNYSCSSQALSLDCSDSWTCFSGICETAREGSVTTQSLVTSSASIGSSATLTVPASSASVPATQQTPSDAENSSAKLGGGGSSSKLSIIVGSVLGVICLCLALIIALLMRRRNRRGQETRAANNPPIEYTEIAPASGTIQPFLQIATQSSHSSTKTSGGQTSAASLAGPSPPIVREEVREAVESRSRNNVTSWRTDALPPSYSHR
ncbi:hypothetical protein C8R44DRAFT_421159 [Mycena epipterygia]|nr:hypothetical protein C8R44DRAFT_421159 [Mycena epipterygia]